jgi:hypothetical protein
MLVLQKHLLQGKAFAPEGINAYEELFFFP